jgi:hypothetical protein
MVTAIPVTGVSGSPALNVSTVFSIHGIPICSLIAVTTSFAVTGFPWAPAGAAHAAATANTTDTLRHTPMVSFIASSLLPDFNIPGLQQTRSARAKPKAKTKGRAALLLPGPFAFSSNSLTEPSPGR